MSLKPLTPLGLAFCFALLLAGWASAANGLAPSTHRGKLAAAVQQHPAMSTDSPRTTNHTSHKRSSNYASSTAHPGQGGQRGAHAARLQGGASSPHATTTRSNGTTTRSHLTSGTSLGKSGRDNNKAAQHGHDGHKHRKHRGDDENGQHGHDGHEHGKHRKHGGD